MSELHKIAHLHNLKKKQLKGQDLIDALDTALCKHAVCWQKPYDDINVKWLFDNIDLASKSQEIMTLEQFFDIVAEGMEKA